MRLEDWQKFIESQFLEDNAALEAEAPLSPESRKTAPADNIPLDFVQANAKSAPAVEPKTPSVQMYPTFLNSPRTSKPETSSTEQTATHSVRSPFVPVTLNDEEMPEFGAYLPAYAVTDSIVHTLAETEPTPTVLAINLEEPAQIPAQPAPLLEHSERRIPKSRARHLRNSSEAESLKTVSPAELWSGIPKYLETLLAMERTNDTEVAQYSYKSPFLEKRRELIHRLLDPELSLEETARLLCICPTTVRRYTNRGILRCTRKEIASGRSETAVTYDTRQRRFRLTDILLFLETQREMLDKDRRHDAKTLFMPPNNSNAHSQESEL